MFGSRSKHGGTQLEAKQTAALLLGSDQHLLRARVRSQVGQPIGPGTYTPFWCQAGLGWQDKMSDSERAASPERSEGREEEEVRCPMMPDDAAPADVNKAPWALACVLADRCRSMLSQAHPA